MAATGPVDGVGDQRPRGDGLRFRAATAHAPWTHPVGCTWGSSSAPTRVVVVGDSIAGNYVIPLREIALNSGGQIQVYTLAMGGCEFVNDLIYTDRPRCVSTLARAGSKLRSTTSTPPGPML